MTPEEFVEREKAEEGEREESEKRWAEHKEGREAKKEERSKWLDGLKEGLSTKATQAEETMLKPAEGNVLGKRAALIRVIKDTSAFLSILYEAVAKAELKVEDVEDSDPPAQKVMSPESCVLAPRPRSTHPDPVTLGQRDGRRGDFEDI